jgi:hypothetical protein
MSERQPDLFGTPEKPPQPRVSDDVVQLIRQRLRQQVAMVREAQTMPWPDRISIIHAENGFLADKQVLPAAEAAALWAEFDRELDRLFAITEAAEIAAGLE